MILRILEAEVRGPHHLELSFSDGAGLSWMSSRS